MVRRDEHEHMGQEAPAPKVAKGTRRAQGEGGGRGAGMSRYEGTRPPTTAGEASPPKERGAATRPGAGGYQEEPGRQHHQDQRPRRKARAGRPAATPRRGHIVSLYTRHIRGVLVFELLPVGVWACAAVPVYAKLGVWSLTIAFPIGE
jgi:hypothetical protein